MRIAILGCGAMGTVMGAYLTKNGCPVDMIDAYADHVKALNEKGAHIIGRVDFTVPVKALLPEDMEGIYDLVFLFTKQTANDVVLPNLLPHLGPDSVVCTLQNGVPEPFVAEHVGADRTVGGTVMWGATFRGPGVSEQPMEINIGKPLFAVGEISGEITERIKKVASVLEYMGPVKITDSLMKSRWEKLVINACGSGMSAACGCPFGELLNNPRAHACMSYLAHEVYLCGEAAGYQMPDHWQLGTSEQFETSQERFFRIYDRQREAKASMLQDLEAGRRTEVNMINGYVCATGDQYGIDTPYNDAVVDVVSRMEKGELPLSMENLQYFPTVTY